MEGQFRTEACAPLRIGGLPDPDAGETRFALEIPCGLSLLAAHDPNATILGLDAFPEDERPDPRPVHIAFQIMVGIGFLLVALGLRGLWILWRRGGHLHRHRLFLWLLVIASPLGFLAIEAGWVVTEVGRQPWIIYGIMRVEDAVTPMPGLTVPFAVFTLIYLGLAVIVAYLLRRQVLGAPRIYATSGTPAPDDTGTK